MEEDNLKDILEEYFKKYSQDENIIKEYNLFNILKLHENNHSNLLAWLFDTKNTNEELKKYKKYIENTFQQTKKILRKRLKTI